MPCLPNEIELTPCEKKAARHERNVEQYTREHPTTDRGIWAVFWCWAFNNCREENNDEQSKTA